MRGLSLRTRLTGWYTLGLGSTLLVFGVLVDRALVGTLRREFDERLASAAGVVQFAVTTVVADVARSEKHATIPSVLAASESAPNAPARARVRGLI